MKKTLTIVVTIVAVIALGNVLLASAQGGTQPNQPTATCPVSGYTCPFSGTLPYGAPHGMMGGGMMSGNYAQMHGAMMGANGMHEQVWTAIAQMLGLTYAELNTALQNGQTIAQLAEAKGVALEDLQQVARNAHEAALADLVEQGALTQEQADWMLDHVDDMPMFNFEQGFGPGMMQGGRGSGGMGPGMMGGRGMRGWQQPTGPQG